MTNPIQTVLNAEAQALRDVEAEEKTEQARIGEARQHARQIVQRNEARTLRVTKRYEALCERDLISKIDKMIHKSEKELDQFSQLSENDRRDIVESVLAMLSPGNEEQLNQDQ